MICDAGRDTYARRASMRLKGNATKLPQRLLGIWLVSFMRYDLGYIDLEQRTLHPPLNNPQVAKITS